MKTLTYIADTVGSAKFSSGGAVGGAGTEHGFIGQRWRHRDQTALTLVGGGYAISCVAVG